MLLSVEARGFPWWGWLLIILAILLVLLLLWWWSRRKAARPQAEVRAPTATPAAPAAPATPAADDLELIEGIGPKIAGLLRGAGISTFAQLAATDVGRLREILEAAKLRLADPATWPEQAALAAAGKWEELKALQERLKGGRRA